MGEVDFIKRNEIRKRQFEFASKDWTRQVGDRVQLSRDHGNNFAWDSGKITQLEQGVIGASMPVERTTVQMDNGIVYTEEQLQTNAGGWVDRIPIVPHEDYFKEDGERDE